MKNYKSILTDILHSPKKLLNCTIILLVIIALTVTLQPIIDKNISVSNSYNGRELPIYCVDTEEKVVALSFDAAWGNADTSDILSVLAKHDVKVTFFMTGGWVESFPEDVKAIAAAGHDLGNHGENHKHMSELSKDECKEEIIKVHEKVKELTGIEMTLFRPPFGDYNDTLINVTSSIDYYCIQWDVDSLDWKDYGAESIVKTVVNHKNLGNGSIILCHNGAKYTKDALDEMITELENQGYKFVPISQLIYTGDYYLNHEGRQFKK